MASAVAQLVVRITSDVKGAQQGLEEVTSTSDRMKKGLGTAAKVATGVLLAVGAAALSAASAAAEDEQAQAVLANTMRKSAGATDAQIASTEDWISKMAAATGVADDQLRPALGALVRATGDTEKAQKALSVAMDVSAATGKPLQSISEAMAKGFGGTTTSLGRLVPGIDKATLASGDMTKIMAELSDKTGGSAAAAAKTTAGQMAIMKNSMNEAKESIGAGLLPVLGILAKMLAVVGDFAQKHSKAFTFLVIAIMAVAAAVVVLNAAMTVLAIVTSPITLIVLAIVAAIVLLAAGFYLAYTRSETFRKIVDGALAGIVTAVKALAAAFKAAWDAVLAAGKAVASAVRSAWNATLDFIRNAVAVVRQAFANTWGAIRDVGTAVAGAVRNAWSNVMGALTSLVQTYRTVVGNVFSAIRTTVGNVADAVETAWRNTFSGLRNAISGLGEALSAPFRVIKGAIDNVIGAVQSLVSWLGKIHVPKIHLPGVGSKAAVTARAPTVARYAAPALAGPQGRSTGATATAGGISIIVQGAIDPEATARQIQRILSGHSRRVGVAR